VTAFIPSPPWNAIHVGPLSLHLYGLMLAIGVLAAYKIAEIRYAQRGGDPSDISKMAVTIVVCGVIGARVYHLFTGYNWNQEGLSGTYKIWNGGLSIWGAVMGGVIGLLFMARRLHLDAYTVTDSIGPGVVVAQAIGRWGNYFNQELYGRPATVPWALKIDITHRVAPYLNQATFQPTFLYESLWCLFVFGAIVFCERRFRFRKGQATAMYVGMYTFGRTYTEWLRADPASKVYGIRFNLMLSIVICVCATVWFIILARRGESEVVHFVPAAERGKVSPALDHP
jgi:prolipoprotein diacylglyceryl transferase